MSESVDSLFENAIERYKAGEDPQKLIPVFKDICDRVPKNPIIWICLSWLYLLTDKPDKAYKAAQKSVKLAPEDPQARINLALAMLETKKSGVRQHIEVAQQMLPLDSKIRAEVDENIADGLNKKPDWKSLQRVKNWLAT
ncbi:MAG: tetratricopeptide repeat protein [Prochloraceae cyanobacterium]